MMGLGMQTQVKHVKQFGRCGKHKENAIICKQGAFNDINFTKCPRAHVVISLCCSQSGGPSPVFARERLSLLRDAPFIVMILSPDTDQIRISLHLQKSLIDVT